VGLAIVAFRKRKAHPLTHPRMCLYLGVVEHLLDVVAYCMCRVLELSLFTCMMVCGSLKAKLTHGPTNELEQ